VARVADHGDLEERIADAHALADGPRLHVGPVDGQILADRARRHTDRLQVVGRREQHLALRRVRVRAAFEATPDDRQPPFVTVHPAALSRRRCPHT
jgi:hypothetical protein